MLIATISALVSPFIFAAIEPSELLDV